MGASLLCSVQFTAGVVCARAARKGEVAGIVPPSTATAANNDHRFRMYLPPQKQRYYIWVPEQNMLLNPTHYKEVSGLMQEQVSIHRRADASLGASCRVHEEFHLWVNNLWCRWCEA